MTAAVTVDQLVGWLSAFRDAVHEQGDYLTELDSAIGDADVMRAQLDASPYLAAYLEAVEEYRLGWSVEEEDRIVAPAFDGSTEMRYARRGDAA